MITSADVVEELARLGGTGAAVIVGTCDAARVPEVSRAWGFCVLRAGNAIEICVYAGSGRRTLANLAENARAAVTITSQTTYRSVQVKGGAGVTAADEADLRRVAEHQRAFVEEVAAIGLPKEASVRLFEDERTDSPAMMKIRVGLDAVFDQTPGPGAGARL